VIMRRSEATPSVATRPGRQATPNVPERSPYAYHNQRPDTPVPAPRRVIAEHHTRSGATLTEGRLAGGGSAEAVTATIALRDGAPAHGAAHGSHPTHPFHARRPHMMHSISDIYGTYDHMPVRSHAGTLDALCAPSALIGHFTHRSAPITEVRPKLAAHRNMPDTY